MAQEKQIHSSPRQAFSARNVAVATAAAAVFTGVVAALGNAAAPMVVTSESRSGAALGVNLRMIELTNGGIHAAPYGIYRFDNPDTKQAGVMEVIGRPDERGCQTLLVSGGAVGGSRVPDGRGGTIAVARPITYCP